MAVKDPWFRVGVVGLVVVTACREDSRSREMVEQEDNGWVSVFYFFKEWGILVFSHLLNRKF
jgi:hypothetical protein